MGTGTCLPDNQYRMPGKNKRRNATPANKLDSVTDTLSVKLPNVRRTVSHKIYEAPGLAQQETPDGGARRCHNLPSVSTDRLLICNRQHTPTKAGTTPDCTHSRTVVWTERHTDTLEILGVHGPTVVAAKPDLRMVEFITDCWQPSMTSLFAFKQIVTGSYLLTDDRLCFDVCGTADGSLRSSSWTSS